jgi:formylglycine-generating enzyme
MGKMKAIHGVFGGLALFLFASCGQTQSSNLVSSKTGWNYNDPKLGGFQVAQYNGQLTPPGMSFVEGGRFVMGQSDEDVMNEYNNIPHTVSVSSFYMDQAEVANVDYREYMYWIGRVYGQDYPNLIYSALPDTTCWRSALQYNEPMVEHYFREAGYNYYPVVGVTWKQANDYCAWRTDRINELILIRTGVLKKNSTQTADENFTLKAYTSGQYLGAVGVKIRDLDPTGAGFRPLGQSDGILLPEVRLPTEAEWEFAALALVGNNPDPDVKRRRGEEVVLDRQVYPWGDNNSTREGTRNQYQGEQLANFRRAKGDYAGVAGALNDHAFTTATVYAYKPNSYGLYNMAGNVNEWVMDVYRPDYPTAQLNPVRQSGDYLQIKALEDGSLDEKDSLGRLPQIPITQEQLADKRVNYVAGDQSDYEDGDTNTSEGRLVTYQNLDNGTKAATTLISNEEHVIKGGSWNDIAFFLSPGVRRHYKASHSSSTIGFRCVMDKMAGPTLGSHAGNYFRGGKR